MAVNPYGGGPGYYPPAYPQQPNPYAPPAGIPGQPYGGPDMYAGYPAPPPGGGLQGGVASIGNSLGGIFGVISNLLNTVIGLVTSVVKGVFDLLGSIFKPILGLFGIGKNDQQQQQAARQQQGQAMPQMPLYRQEVEQALQAAESSILQYEQYAREAQTDEQKAMLAQSVLNRAMADFQQHRERLTRVGRPDQVAAFDARAMEVLQQLEALAGAQQAAAPAATQAQPGDLSNLQLPNDPALQQNLMQFRQNFQTLAQAPAQAATLTAEQRQLVTQAIAELAQQAEQFRAASPQVADTLGQAVVQLATQWQQAINASPAAPAQAATTGQVANGAGRRYREVPLELPAAPTPAGSRGN